MSVIDRIKYDGVGEEIQWLIKKYPGEEFVFGTQLIVGQGQEALFVKGGEALDLFESGTYTLNTENLPLLKKIVNMPFGGKTPFSAEIYYINRITHLNMNWGTATPFQIEDPKYNIILSIRCFGKYGFKIIDSRLFVSELIGVLPSGRILDSNFLSSYFSGLITNKIKGVISSFMINNRISFLEVTSFLEELSLKCKGKIEDEFRRFGVEVVNFFIESISPPRDEYNKLQAYKEELALGNDFYRQRRSFDILESVANNPSGNIVNTGMEMGMGLGMIPLMKDIVFSANGKEEGKGEEEVIVCTNCNSKNKSGQKFCGNCGKVLEKENVCSQCGRSNPKGQKFCGNCGNKLLNICGKCGNENDLNQNFCGKCGNRL